jgi:hypothetical protein
MQRQMRAQERNQVHIPFCLIGRKAGDFTESQRKLKSSNSRAPYERLDRLIFCRVLPRMLNIPNSFAKPSQLIRQLYIDRIGMAL